MIQPFVILLLGDLNGCGNLFWGEGVREMKSIVLNRYNLLGYFRCVRYLFLECIVLFNWNKNIKRKILSIEN